MFNFDAPNDTPSQSYAELMVAIKSFYADWKKLHNSTNLKYSRFGDETISAVLAHPDIRPFPAGVYFPAPDCGHLNPTELAMRDLADYEASLTAGFVTLARMIATQTPSSMPVVNHKYQSDVKATATGLGKISIRLPVDQDEFIFYGKDSTGGNHDVDIGSTHMPGCHVTKWHSDYSSAHTTVHHFTGKKMWLVCPYTPGSAPTFLRPLTRSHPDQKVGETLKELPFIYVAVVSDPTAFILSPLDHHAVLSLTPSVHCGGKAIMRDERGLFWMAQDYYGRLLELKKNKAAQGEIVKRAIQELEVVPGIITEYIEKFGIDLAFVASEYWGPGPISKQFLSKCLIRRSSVPAEFQQYL